jgi:hypothetical protein
MTLRFTFPLSMTWAELAALYTTAEIDDALGEDLEEAFESSVYDDAAECIESNATALNDNFRLWLKARGCDLRTDGLTIVCRESLELMHAMAMMIMAEYDNAELRGNDNLWTLFGLGGDDDVDYNGGYLTGVYELLTLPPRLFELDLNEVEEALVLGAWSAQVRGAKAHADAWLETIGSGNAGAVEAYQAMLRIPASMILKKWDAATLIALAKICEYHQWTVTLNKVLTSLPQE